MNALKGFRILILLMLISYAALSAVLFTPALPQLATYFQISDSMAQATMSIFLVGYALGQLPYAPLANRYGRKKTIYIGLALAILGTIVCLIAPSIHLFFIGRFLEAIGAAVGLKITFTMIGDSYAGSEATKKISYIMLAFAITPGLGVALGGFLTVFFGWKSCFLFLVVYTFLLGLFCLWLPETARSLDKEALQLKKIWSGYLRQFSNPALFLHALLAGLGASAIYIFATKAPYIGINQMGLSPAQYGAFNLIPLIGLGLGQILSVRLAGKIPPRTSILWGMLGMFFGSALMFVFFISHWMIAWTLFVPQALLMLGNSLVFSNAASEGLSSSSDKSNASAVLQFTNMAVAALGTYVISSWVPKNAIMLPLVYGVIVLFAFGLWIKLRPHHAKHS
jgi:predicted MFS family arabinose efflux permease